MTGPPTQGGGETWIPFWTRGKMWEDEFIESSESNHLRGVSCDKSTKGEDMALVPRP